MAARPLPPATPTGEADVNLDRRLGRGTLGRLRAAMLPVCVRGGRVAASLFRRLGAPVAAGVSRAVRKPRRFAVFALAGVVAGTAAGFVGPLVGAAFGGLAAFAIALGASPGRREKVCVMSARQKLNAAYAAGSLLLTALIGGAAQSAIVFWVALGVLLVLNLVAGDIRPKGR
jgi:hypothetical protein